MAEMEALRRQVESMRLAAAAAAEAICAADARTEAERAAKVRAEEAARAAEVLAAAAEEAARAAEVLAAAATARAEAAETRAAKAARGDAPRAAWAAPAVPALAGPLPSPTKGGASALLDDDSFWGLAAAPLSFESGGAPGSFACALAAARAYGAGTDKDTASGLMAEKAFYALAVSEVPAHVAVTGGGGRPSAGALLGSAALCSSRWAFDGGCFPELATAPRSRQARCPAFQGELKSVDAATLGQALYYTVMDIVGTFFPSTPGAPGAPGAPAAPGRRVFYAAPPLGFALLAFPHVGYFVAVEFVGKALVSPASLPFFLGSAEHGAAVKALPARPAAPPEWEFDPALPWACDAPAPPADAPARPPLSPPVAWAVCPDGTFRKLLRADARSADEWSEAFAAYKALEPLLAGRRGAPGGTAAEPPTALARGARMLFGAHEALVEMEAFPIARGASDEEATGAAEGADADAVTQAVAEAVAWLALRRVLYTDLRGPNVLVAAPRVAGAPVACLVDYDDCVVVSEPVRDVGELRAALGSVARARAARRSLPSVAARGFAERFAAGDFMKLESALGLAFARLHGGGEAGRGAR